MHGKCACRQRVVSSLSRRSKMQVVSVFSNPRVWNKLWGCLSRFLRSAACQMVLQSPRDGVGHLLFALVATRLYGQCICLKFSNTLSRVLFLRCIHKTSCVSVLDIEHRSMGRVARSARIFRNHPSSLHCMQTPCIGQFSSPLDLLLHGRRTSRRSKVALTLNQY